MAITHFQQNLVSTLLLKSTTEKIAFQQAIKEPIFMNAKSAKFPGIADITIGNYVKDTDIDTQVLDDESITLDFDQQKFFSIALDDLDQAQSNSNILSAVVQRGSYALKNEIEKYMSSLHAGAGIVSGLGNSTTPLEVNSANVNDVILTIAESLQTARADEDKFIIVPPWLWGRMVKADQTLATNNMEILGNGFIGSKYGLKIFVTNNVANTTGAKWKVLAGDSEALRLALNIDKLEAIRSEKRFSDIVRGLLVFGAVVSRPETLACATLSQIAEA